MARRPTEPAAPAELVSTAAYDPNADPRILAKRKAQAATQALIDGAPAPVETLPAPASE